MPENFTWCKANLEFLDIFVKVSNTKFHGNPFSEDRVDTRRRRKDGRKDMTNITGVLRDYSNETNNEVIRVTSFVTLGKKLNIQTRSEVAVRNWSSEDVFPCVTCSPYSIHFLNKVLDSRGKSSYRRRQEVVRKVIENIEREQIKYVENGIERC